MSEKEKKEKKPQNPVKLDEQKRKKTAFIVFSGLLIVIAAVVWNIWHTRQAQFERMKKKREAQSVIKTKDVDVIKETWLSKESAKVKELEKQLEELQKKLNQNQEQKASPGQIPPQNFQNQPQRMNYSQKQSTPDEENEKKEDSRSGSQKQQIGNRSGEPNYGYPPPLPFPNYYGQNQDKKKDFGPRPITDVIAVVGKEEVQEVEEKEEKQEKQETNTVEIPAGSFVKAILLSGLDAPTGGKARSMPYPVLMRVIDKSILPNKWQADIKDCFMIGEGIGELSSERVFIRVHTLSCVTESGKTYQKKIKAYVSGEDGKVGLKGMVVSKQGALLARTLVAGFLEGMAKAFAQQNTIVSVSPLGQTQTIDTSKATQIAAVQGLSGTTKKLADFYMKLVDQTFPVIEVNAGRKVDVVFLSEVKFGERK